MVQATPHGIRNRDDRHVALLESGDIINSVRHGFCVCRGRGGWRAGDDNPPQGVQFGQPDRQAAPQQILDLPEESIFVLKDFGHYLQPKTFSYFDVVIAWLGEIRDVLASTGRTVVFLGPDLEVPGALANDVTTIGFPLPNDEAGPLLAEALEARRRVLGEDHAHTLLSMHSLASLYKDQGRYDEAEPLYRRAFEGRRRILGEKDRQTLLALGELVASLIALERFEEAEPLAIECYGGNQDVFGAAHTETGQAIEHLVYLYDGWGKPDQATEWRTSLSATQPAAAEKQPASDGD